MMKIKKIKAFTLVCIALMATLIMIIGKNNHKEMGEVDIRINGEYTDFVPYTRKFTRDADGSFLDNTARQIPYISVVEGDRLSLIFSGKQEIECEVVKYEIYEMDEPLGSPTSKGEPETVDVEQEDRMISFNINEIEVNQQLIVCKFPDKGYYIFRVGRFKED